MAVPPRRSRMPGTYFVMTRTWESRKLFIKPPVCEIVIEMLFHYRDKRSYSLHSFVLMPDHVHLLLTPGLDISLERAVQFVKGGSARRISQTLNYRWPVWQRGYTDHRIRDAQDYESHVRYIESNPVKAGLVVSAKEYPWCSACGRFPTDDCPQGLKPLTKTGAFGTVEQVAEKAHWGVILKPGAFCRAEESALFSMPRAKSRFFAALRMTPSDHFSATCETVPLQ